MGRTVDVYVVLRVEVETDIDDDDLVVEEVERHILPDVEFRHSTLEAGEVEVLGVQSESPLDHG